MKTIVIDDEPIMVKSFVRQIRDVSNIELLGTFLHPAEAEDFARNNSIDMAILDINMPEMDGIELAKRLRGIRSDMLIVFISAYDDYIRESNEIDADYYILKPYTRDTLVKMAQRMEILAKRQKKRITVKMFGVFTVFKDGKSIPLRGKTKEILAVVAAQRGKEISNEEIYSLVWEDRGYSNTLMQVYYNALNRLKAKLEQEGLSELLISTRRGQIFNTDMVSCDYYDFLDRKEKGISLNVHDLLSEYYWRENLFADLEDH